MPYSEATMVGEPKQQLVGFSLVVSWVSTSPPGTWFQVYFDRVLAWVGSDRTITVPWPHDKLTTQVGAVADGEQNVDFSALLPYLEPPDKAVLDWLGGSFLGAVESYAIFMSSVAGGPVNYSKPVGSVPASDGGVSMDGFGMGGFGKGGFGMSASAYEWKSKRLGEGVWTFAVVPIDVAGNYTATIKTTSVAVSPAPRPPAPDGQGRRIWYSLSPPTDGGFGSGGFGEGGFGSSDNNAPIITLNWLPSPSN